MPRRKLGAGYLCRRVAEWPANDRAAWQEAFDDADPFGASASCNEWSERSLIKTERGYGRWLSWLAGRELLKPDQIPGDRVTPLLVKDYVADLAAVNGGFTVLCRVQELYDALRVMAPKRDWGWLRQLQNTLRARAAPVRDKQTRLRSTRELTELGMALMHKAETLGTKPPLTRAVWHRDGLMIALLAHRPLRLANFAAITLGQHLIRQSQGYRLFFTAAEVKSRRPIDVAVPPSLVAAVERYLTHHRQILLTRGGRQDPATCDAFWVSETAVGLDPLSLPNRIKKHTQAAFGAPVWPQLFRDCAATTIAIEDPKHARTIMNILGHTTLRTSEKHYNQARSLDASRRYQALVADLLCQLQAKGL